MHFALSVLNVEDDEKDAELNQAMLSTRWRDCQLIRVDSRPDFVAALERGGFDVILSDFTMPAFDGSEALSLARTKCPETPFLFVSGTIGEDTAIELLKHGASDYVLKHRLMRLVPCVDRALREAAERAEHLRAEEAMRQSEYKYRELFESIVDAVFLTDERSGKIIDANRAAQTRLGSTRSEVLGRKESQFLALDQVNTDAEARNNSPFPCQMLRPDGHRFPVEVRTTFLKLYDRRLLLRMCRSLEG